MGAELASPVTILVREPGRVTAGGGEPLVRSRGVKELLQRVSFPFTFMGAPRVCGRGLIGPFPVGGKWASSAG